MKEERVSATQARIRFGELMRKVAENRQTYIVERGGEPAVVVLSVEEYKDLRQAAADRHREQAYAALEGIAQLQEAIWATEDAGQIPSAEEVIAEVRNGRHEQLDHLH